MRWHFSRTDLLQNSQRLEVEEAVPSRASHSWPFINSMALRWHTMSVSYKLDTWERNSFCPSFGQLSALLLHTLEDLRNENFLNLLTFSNTKTIHIPESGYGGRSGESDSVSNAFRYSLNGGAVDKNVVWLPASFDDAYISFEMGYVPITTGISNDGFGWHIVVCAVTFNEMGKFEFFCPLEDRWLFLSHTRNM